MGLIQSAKAPRQVSLAVFGRCVRPRAKQDFNTFTVPPARSHVQRRLPRDVTRVHVHPRTQGCFVVLFPPARVLCVPARVQQQPHGEIMAGKCRGVQRRGLVAVSRRNVCPGVQQSLCDLGRGGLRCEISARTFPI